MFHLSERGGLRQTPGGAAAAPVPVGLFTFVAGRLVLLDGEQISSLDLNLVRFQLLTYWSVGCGVEPQTVRGVEPVRRGGASKQSWRHTLTDFTGLLQRFLFSDRKVTTLQTEEAAL